MLGFRRRSVASVSTFLCIFYETTPFGNFRKFSGMPLCWKTNQSLIFTCSDIPTTGDSTSVTYASPMKVATCAKFLLFHPRLSSRISMSKVSGNARESKVGHWIHNAVILFPNSKPDGRRISLYYRSFVLSIWHQQQEIFHQHLWTSWRRKIKKGEEGKDSEIEGKERKLLL